VLLPTLARQDQQQPSGPVATVVSVSDQQALASIDRPAGCSSSRIIRRRRKDGACIPGTNPRTAQPAARQGKLFHKLNSESSLNGLINPVLILKLS